MIIFGYTFLIKLKLKKYPYRSYIIQNLYNPINSNYCCQFNSNQSIKFSKKSVPRNKVKKTHNKVQKTHNKVLKHTSRKHYQN